MTAFFRVSEFVELVFPAGNNGSRLLVMIRAAFDASMDQPGGVTAVGGYIGTVDQWRGVEERWVNLLSLHRMDKFRLTDVFQKLNFEGAIERSLEFAQIIRDSDLRFVCAYMDDADWAQAEQTPEYKRVYPHRQHACLGLLLRVLADEIETGYSNAPCAIVFDNDYGNLKSAAVVYDEWRARAKHPGFGIVAFTKGDQEWDVVPLQCADLLAGAIRRSPMTKQDLASFTSTGGTVEGVGMIAHSAMKQGRSTHWSIAVARGLEERLRKQREDR